MKTIKRIWAWTQQDIGPVNISLWISQYFFWFGIGVCFTLGILESL